MLEVNYQRTLCDGIRLSKICRAYQNVNGSAVINAFDRPPEPIESGDQVQRARRPRQIGAPPRHRRLASRQNYDAEATQTAPALKWHVEVHALASVLGEEPRQPNGRRLTSNL